jgi:hypothetical protein
MLFNSYRLADKPDVTRRGSLALEPGRHDIDVLVRS